MKQCRFYQMKYTNFTSKVFMDKYEEKTKFSSTKIQQNKYEVIKPIKRLPCHLL